MKFFKKFKVNKKVEAEVSPVINNEAIVKLKEVKERKHRLLFVFEEENNSTPFWLIAEKDEEELKKLFQALTESKYQEEYKTEKEIYDSQIKSIEEEYKSKIQVEADKKIEEPEITFLKTTKEEQKKILIEERKAKIKARREEKSNKIKSFELEKKQKIEAKEKPLTPHKRFENADLDDKDLIGKELKVYALGAIKGGKEVRLIQSWQGVN